MFSPKTFVSLFYNSSTRRLASTGDILGESMLKFLKEVGRSDIAVHFVKDPGVRFALAVDLHNVDLAVESAQQLDSQGHWEKVAEMALLFGRLTVAETAYQKAGRLLLRASTDVEAYTSDRFVSLACLSQNARISSELTWIPFKTSLQFQACQLTVTPVTCLLYTMIDCP